MTRDVRQHAPGRAPRGACLRKATRNTQGVIRSGLDVKSWAEKLPTPEEVRPACCPGCGAASRPLGGHLVLHGHGVRSRQLRGPTTADGTPLTRLVVVRRYRCQRCGATPTVVPAGVVARYLFSGPAVALALALFGVTGLALAEVRRRVSPWATVGATAAAGWGTLRRWAAAVRAGRLFGVRAVPEGWTARQVAARAATTLAARAPAAAGTADVVADAFVGALSG